MGFRRYWYRVAARALKDTVALMGWGNWRVFAFRSTALLVAIAALIAWAPDPVGTDEMIVRAFLFGATIGAFILLFLGFFVAAPHKLDRELRQEASTRQDTAAIEITQLREGLANKQTSQESAKKLEAVYETGKTLLTKPKGIASGEWRMNIINWFQDAETALEEENFPNNEIWMFKTVCDPPQPKTPFQECPKILSIRLDKLRLIISRINAVGFP